ncbi:cation:proton antiporter domain-containing protein [Streptomyces olivochromogenes]|uniref:cation:proton antiporter domain-containing protein n=1 Tax=Streptomyces olivochromogenes TaxID=1963 RepID=UPI001F2E4D94|nr:cation:proton antiporter [Streptomyces olivochromogenes]MCF3131683.1 cation:proton antiporter [Streptomyces olivochromogenes]
MAAEGLPVEAIAMADVAIVLLAGRLFVRLSGRFRQPPVVAEIAIGIMLGPSLLGLLPGDLPGRIFPDEARPMLSAVSQVGLLLFMFLAGWEMDLGRLRGRGRSVGGMAGLSMAVPFLLGAGTAALLAGRYADSKRSTTAFVLFLSTAFAITAFPVLARIIKDSGLTGTRVGSTAMACAAVGDVLAWCVLVLVVAVSEAGGPGHFWTVLGLTAAYGLVMGIAVRRLLRFMIGRSPRAASGANLLVLIASGVFLSAWVTSWIGIHAIFGAFAFGLVMPRESREDLHRRVAMPLGGVVALLLPVFFIVTGLSVDVGVLGLAGLAYLGLILCTAIVGKYAGTVLPARMSGMSWREAGAFGTLMNTRGLTEIVMLDIGRQLGVIDTEMFSMMVIMALVTTAMAGPLLHRLGITHTAAPLDGTHSQDPARPEGDTGRLSLAKLRP